MSKKNTMNALISGVGILIGRLSGLIREILYAYLFGTSPLIGLFKYAAALPNLARRMFGEGALSNAFIPLLAEIDKNDRGKATDFSSKIVTLFTLFNIFLAGLGILTLIICGKIGIIPEENLALVELGSIMLPYLPFICLCGMLGSILNLFNSYKLPALMSSAMNICLIASSTYAISQKLVPEKAVHLLAWTLLFSGLLQAIILLKATRQKISLSLSFSSPKSPELKSFWISFLPVLVGASAQQISTALDKTIALWIGTHAVAALSYSELLIYLPVGVIGVALGSVCLPSLSKSLAKGDTTEVEQSFSTALGQVFFLSVPCSFFFYIAGEQILSCIFMRGAFDQQSLVYTLQAFIWLLPGIPFFAALKVVLPLYYAHKNTKSPLRISLFMITLNLILGISFIPLLSHGSLAMASSITAALNFFLLLKGAVKQQYLKSTHIIKTITQTLSPAALATVITNYSDTLFLIPGENLNGLIFNIISLGINLIYFSALYIIFYKLFQSCMKSSKRS